MELYGWALALRFGGGGWWEWLGEGLEFFEASLL